MDLLNEFLDYCEPYEIHRNYAFWSAIGLSGAVIHRKVYFLHGSIEIFPNVYVLMVGPQGNGKSTASGFARNLFRETCPDLAIGASTQSAEDIIVTMSKEDFVRYFLNELGETVEVRPYAFFINEFKNFIAFAPVRMLNFLSDMYDSKVFDSSTIKRGLENVINPMVNILACENPDQLVKFMKNDVMTGGISRRFILVNELGYAKPRPKIPTLRNKDNPIWQKMVERIVNARKITGVFKWETSGYNFFEPWYLKKQASLNFINNPSMQGYISTKHIQLFKICMLLDTMSDKPMLLFTEDLLQRGLALLDVIEPNMAKLSLSAGRNESLPAQQQILETLRMNGGFMAEKKLMKEVEREFRCPQEMYSVFSHLTNTDQVLKKSIKLSGDSIERVILFLPEAYEAQVKAGNIQVKKL